MDRLNGHFRKHVIIVLVTLLILYLGVALYTFLSLWTSGQLDTRDLAYNQARVLLNPILVDIENNYQQMTVDDQHDIPDMMLAKIEAIDGSLEVIGLDGRVYFHSSEENMQEATVYRDLRTDLHYDLSFASQNQDQLRFSFPIIVDGEQRLIAIFELPETLFRETLSGRERYPVILVFALLTVSYLAVLMVFIKVNKGILKPIQKLSSFAHEISRGHYDASISISDGTDIDELFRDFDFMRQEIKNAKTRQQELAIAHKELIASISHDLQTPVACIKANVEGILDGIVTNEAMMTRYLTGIKERSDSLSRLIQDLMTHAVQQLHKMKMDIGECYSKKVLENIFQQLASLTRQNDKQLQVDGDIPDVLIAIDPGRIEQVLMNLVQNAEKYSSHDAKITLRCQLDETSLIISVIDSGPGIAPEEMPFVFDKFYRGKHVRDHTEGTGLGLSICQYIIEQHGGTITAKSNEDGGSTFMFTLPLV